MPELSGGSRRGETPSHDAAAYYAIDVKKRVTAITLTALLALAALWVASCGGKEGAGGQASPRSETRPVTAPTQGTVVNVPSSASKSQIDACMAQARADGPGTSVVFPAGRFAYAGTLVVPDYINLSGQGIWDQGVADGAGGTWLQCPIKWGSYSTISKLLLGFNSAGQACTFTPCPAGSSACGSYTQAHGSTGCTFSLVRFKGGADAGANLFYTANYGVGWSTATDPVKRDSLIDTTFEDCEFERPQATNSVGVTSMFKGGNPGSIMCLWIDSRAGGGDITGNRWIRCHFGVKNGYHSGVDGYGIGTTFLIQPGPDGPGKTSDPADNGDSYSSAPTRAANWNPDFDWNQITHTASDNSFVDCLFEYACWYPMDLCDWDGNYSAWMGTYDYVHGLNGQKLDDGGVAAGWGDNPGSQWVNIPSKYWVSGLDMTDCYEKGSSPNGHSVVGENASDCVMTDCYCGTGGAITLSPGPYGKQIIGSFPGGHPQSPIFTVDWSGAGTSYTPSPYDP